MGLSSAIDWVAAKIEPGLKVSRRTSEGFLLVKTERDTEFVVAVLGVEDTISSEHIIPVFSHLTSPSFVVNVPSKALWSGDAIEIIHGAPAAFGTLSELGKASALSEVHEYRHREYKFFDDAIRQHRNVRHVTRVFDSVFRAHRKNNHKDLTIALINSYNMSAEDIRNAVKRYGNFDIAVKVSSYGGISSSAITAADSIGIEPMTFGGLLGRLHKK